MKSGKILLGTVLIKQVVSDTINNKHYIMDSLLRKLDILNYEEYFDQKTQMLNLGYYFNIEGKLANKLKLIALIYINKKYIDQLNIKADFVKPKDSVEFRCRF